MPLLSVALLLAGCGPADPPRPAVRRPLLPPPTENVVEEGEEEEQHERREAWNEERHRAPPGVDWKAVERTNARATLDRARQVRAGNVRPLGAWVERGSENQAGSMFTVRHTPDGRLYAGSALGGLWRGREDGTGWTPVGDVLYGGAHQVVWLAGDPEVLLSAPTSGGLLTRSDDDGATWAVPAGVEDLGGVRAMQLASDGAVWVLGSRGRSGVLLRSGDRGARFEEQRAVSSGAGLWVARDGTPRLAIASDDTLEISADGGRTFEARALPDASGSWWLTASEATDPPTFYVARPEGYDEKELWRSDDGGATWTPLGGHGDFWDVLVASVRDPALVAFGGVDLHVSRDGGATFESPNTWDEYYADPEHKLHADMMAVTVEPVPGAERWSIGCHGGVYVSTDGLRTVRNLSLSGLRVGQYYSSLTAWDRPERVLVGAQDQGLQHATGAEGDGRWDLEQVWSGDYGHLVSQDGTHRWVFGVYPGFVMSWNEEGGLPVLGYLQYPPGDGAPWLPYLTADPEKRKAFWFLGDRLWRYEWNGNGFDAVQATSDPFEGWLTALVFAPDDPTLAWLTTSTGRVYRSEDGGQHWKRAAKDVPEPNFYYGTSLVASRRTPGTIYVGGAGYGGDPVFRSLDGGDHFEPWSEGLPPTLIYTLVEARDGTGRLFAGTETGVWARDPAGGDWVDVSAGRAPTTTYWSAEVLPHEDTIRFSTYGRGLWDLQLEPPGEGCWPLLDADGDGVGCELDCDDADPAVSPLEEEDACDGVDADCDGIPELDEDGDGAFSCDDCDDADPARAPGREDLFCDEVDQDCDGEDLCPTFVGGGGCDCDHGRGPGAGALLFVAAVVRSRRSRRSLG